MSAAEALAAAEGAGPGPELRRAREARGLTRQQAAEHLNLDVAMVEALELDDFERLGAPVFAKGHLRRYGAMLGLAGDELIAAYERGGAPPMVPVLVPRARARQDMMPARNRPRWPWLAGSALLFALAAGVAAYLGAYGLRWPAAAGESAGTAPEVEPVAPGTRTGGADAPAAVTAAAAQASPDATVQPAPAGTDAGAESAAPVPPGHVRVRLAFVADSWAEVYDGSGQAVLYDLARAGTQRSIAAAAPLSVTIGNAPAVTLAVNGRTATLPAVPGGGTVARFRIEADGTVR